MLLVGFDFRYQVLTDEGGLPLRKGDLELLEERIALHKQHSPLELEAIARRIVAKHYPGMLTQIDFDMFSE